MELEQYFHQGRIKLEIIPHEMKMSHWVYAPVLTDTKLNKCILNLTNKVWDLESVKETEHSIMLLLKKYSKELRQYELEIFIDKNEASINGTVISISEIEASLQKLV